MSGVLHEVQEGSTIISGDTLSFFTTQCTVGQRMCLIQLNYLYTCNSVAASSLSTFRRLLNRFLFEQSYPDIICWRHPASGPCSGCTTLATLKPTDWLIDWLIDLLIDWLTVLITVTDSVVVFSLFVFMLVQLCFCVANVFRWIKIFHNPFSCFGRTPICRQTQRHS